MLKHNRQEQFFRKVLRILEESGIPFMIGGSYAYMHHTKTLRPTKDIDIFCTIQDWRRAMKSFQKSGLKTEVTYPKWLGKVYDSHNFADIIYSSNNGKNVVTKDWLARAKWGKMLGHNVRVISPADIVLTKIYIMARDCFHGHDIYKLVQAVGSKLDWNFVWEKAQDDWQLLYAHTLIFDYVFPKEKEKIPAWIRKELEKKTIKYGSNKSSVKFQGNMLTMVDYSTPAQIRKLHNHPKRK